MAEEVKAEQIVDTEMVAPEEEEEVLELDKIIMLPGSSVDGTAASFQIKNEDHTLGNPLRYIIMKK